MVYRPEQKQERGTWMQHPFDRIPGSQRTGILTVLVTATIIVLAILYAVGKPLKSLSAPCGIVSLQVAGNLEQSQKILASWDGLEQQKHPAHPTRRVYAAFNLGLDFLFLVLYSNTIALACICVANFAEKRPCPPGKGRLRHVCRSSAPKSAKFPPAMPQACFTPMTYPVYRVPTMDVKVSSATYAGGCSLPPVRSEPLNACCLASVPGN